MSMTLSFAPPRGRSLSNSLKVASSSALQPYRVMTSPAPDLRFPVGRLQRATTLASDARRAAIDAIAAAPALLRKAVAGLTDAQLDTPYRPDGWTVRQVVHLVADSHMHASARTRYALA